jgi:prepilin-type N-terminal cleavage/methylation domain-containing protein
MALARDERGFSLVELMVVLLVLSILMTVGLASYAQMTRIADDKGTQLDLLTAVKVQALQHLETGSFTDDVGVLFDLEPTLRFSNDGEPKGTVVVRIEDGRSEIDVCLFSQTKGGEWFAVSHSVSEAVRYSESTPVACTPGNVASWSTESW